MHLERTEGAALCRPSGLWLTASLPSKAHCQDNASSTLSAAQSLMPSLQSLLCHASPSCGPWPGMHVLLQISARRLPYSARRHWWGPPLGGRPCNAGLLPWSCKGMLIPPADSRIPCVLNKLSKL